jgi:hypothetical protein
MRRLAYILILIGVWLVGMAGLMLGMDSLLHPPFFPHALFAGGYWAALCSWRSSKRSANGCRRDADQHPNPFGCCPQVALTRLATAKPLRLLILGTG